MKQNDTEGNVRKEINRNFLGRGEEKTKGTQIKWLMKERSHKLCIPRMKQF